MEAASQRADHFIFEELSTQLRFQKNILCVFLIFQLSRGMVPKGNPGMWRLEAVWWYFLLIFVDVVMPKAHLYTSWCILSTTVPVSPIRGMSAWVRSADALDRPFFRTIRAEISDHKPFEMRFQSIGFWNLAEKLCFRKYFWNLRFRVRTISFSNGPNKKGLWVPRPIRH